MSGWWKSLSRFLAAVGGCGLFLGGLLLASWQAQESLSDDDRYRIPFAEIECDAPPGLNRVTFLIEVRYLSECPSRVSLLDRDLFAKLDAALRQHPRVDRLDDLTVTPDKRLRLKVRFKPT